MRVNKYISEAGLCSRREADELLLAGRVTINGEVVTTGAKALDRHVTFITKLQDTIDAGVGNLVDADLAKESAKLQALQTKQQLGIQALSIANSSSSSLLSLFR